MQEIAIESDAGTNLNDLLDRVEAGETIVLMRAGEPVAQLIPHEPISYVNRQELVNAIRQSRNEIAWKAPNFDARNLIEDGRRY